MKSNKRLTTEEYIQRAIKAHGTEKYRYDKTIYINGSTKVEIFCMKHQEYFWTSPTNFIKIKNSCPKCINELYKNTRYTTEEFIKRAKDCHEIQYDYSKVEYINNHTDVIIICPIHGEFKQVPSVHLRPSDCPKCVEKRLGIDKRLTQDEWVARAVEKWEDRFDYSKTVYTTSEEKVLIRCKRHDFEFKQLPNAHLFYKFPCPLCLKEQPAWNKSNVEEFVERAKLIHLDKYDYSKFIYVNKETKGIVYCKKCDINFEITPSSHLDGVGCSYCQMSVGENRIEKFLKLNNIKYKYEKRFSNCRSHKNFCLVFDFFLPDYNMCIEFDGIQHFRAIGKKDFKLSERQRNDTIKNSYCISNNINLLRIKYDQIEEIENILIDSLKISLTSLVA